MNIKEHEDKDTNNGSGRSSPCLSTESQSSSMASNGVRMTSFAERKFQQHRFGSNQDLRSRASSSQRTTPDGSESSGPLSSSWRLRRDQSPSPRSGDGCNVLATEMVQLRMQLEEKRRAIEHQKRKMEVLSARQRQKLGKAAFLYIIKKEEQGMVKPKAPKPQQKHSPKTVLREESSSDNFSKGSSLSDNLSTAQSGSSLSLDSAATNEADSVNSGGAGSQRCDSVESFPVHHNNNQAAERDWDNGSTASSIASLAEYTGSKLFKGLSTKSNKTIIHNAISYCCLAGKVNEPQKNQILKELENTESNHMMILFRDASCKFRALYSYFPDTEEIHRLTGIGPKCIGKKMIGKLYKYSSVRKQFTVIPARTVSVSVDAFPIHNHLWQPKRVAVPKNTAK